MFETIIAIAQLVIAVCIIILVILQERGSGIGESFGGGGGGGSISRQRRGFEKVAHQATVVAVILFAISSLSLLFF